MTKKKTPLKWQIETGNIIQFLAVSNGMVYFRSGENYQSGEYDNYLYADEI